MKVERVVRIVLELTEAEALKLEMEMQQSESDFSHDLWHALQPLSLGDLAS